MSFLEKLRTELNSVSTENGDKAYKTTFNACLDFFALAGAARNTPGEKLIRLFYKAYMKEPLTALKLLFYLRDIRGGLGERNAFRVITSALAEDNDKNLRNNLSLFAEYGRWDDLIFLLTVVDNKNSECYYNDIIKIIKDKLTEDYEGEYPSLLAKWLPSENATSTKTKQLGGIVRAGLKLSAKEYRKLLSHLRGKIRVVEKLISSKKWQEVNYESVPSKAMMNYKEAFLRHDKDRYKKYLDSVESGEKKINAATLFPYEIYTKVISTSKQDRTLEAQWKALPDYTQPGQNAIVVADVSGSMQGLPMSVSVSLALYFAERNTGFFKDCFMTFSERPQLIEIGSGSLHHKFKCIDTVAWGYNTDLRAVFMTILDAAIKHNVKQEELPKTIYIISDMQFDAATPKDDNSTYEWAEREFADNGYELPHVVFWNVDARGNDQVPIVPRNKHISLVSGLSPVIFKYVVENKTAEQLMKEVIEAERYRAVKLAE